MAIDTLPPPMDPSEIRLARELKRPPGLPPEVRPEDRERVKADILAALEVTELCNLTVVSGAGWPMISCMHFASAAGLGDRPVVYMFSHEGTRKLASIDANPRVSVAFFRPKEGQSPEETPYLRVQGLIRRVTGPEFQLSLERNYTKPGYEFTQFIGIDKQPALRVDCLDAIWQPPGGTACFIDFHQELQMGAEA